MQHIQCARCARFGLDVAVRFGKSSFSIFDLLIFLVHILSFPLRHGGSTGSVGRLGWFMGVGIIIPYLVVLDYLIIATLQFTYL